METARAFNPFLVTKSDKLKKRIEEVQLKFCCALGVQSFVSVE